MGRTLLVCICAVDAAVLRRPVVMSMLLLWWPALPCGVAYSGDCSHPCHWAPLGGTVSSLRRCHAIVLLNSFLFGHSQCPLLFCCWRGLVSCHAVRAILSRLKNESSLFSMTVRELTTQYRLLLTGTPLQVCTYHMNMKMKLSITTHVHTKCARYTCWFLRGLNALYCCVKQQFSDNGFDVIERMDIGTRQVEILASYRRLLRAKGQAIIHVRYRPVGWVRA